MSSCRILWLAGAQVLYLALGGAARAQTPGCDRLPPDSRAHLAEALAKLHPYDGCDETFAACLARKPRAPVVERLADDVCRQVALGRSVGEIENALARRARSALPFGKPGRFALDERTAIGAADAPVQVVVYACARCPFCSVVVPALHREVSAGRLVGKVRLFYRPFPLKDHVGALEGGQAMLSAARLGSFWPYLLHLYSRYDAFAVARLGEWAGELGLDRAAFDAAFADPAIRAALVASKQEGLRNKVDATPTLFIDGRKYVYENKNEVILDVLEEVIARKGAAR